MIVTVGTHKIEYPALTLDKGLTLFTGPSGSGKTTLLRALHGDLESKGAKALVGNTPSALMPQQNTWVPYLSMGEHLVHFGGESALELAALLQLQAHLKKSPHQLSVGQLQRFSLALTLSQKQPLVLLDEPTSALDDDLAKIAFELVDHYLEKFPEASMIAVTHDTRMKEYFSNAANWTL